ncbi:Thermophilic serine proteinase [Nymphon striatum]|nr:Thermophilic serine proteinase [Nymphon striatum]
MPSNGFTTILFSSSWNALIRSMSLVTKVSGENSGNQAVKSFSLAVLILEGLYKKVHAGVCPLHFLIRTKNLYHQHKQKKSGHKVRLKLRGSRRMLKYDVALASDMADEALIEVWRSAGSFSGLSQPSTWIHSIARFRMIGYLRKNKELLQDDDFEQLNIEDTDLLPEQEVIISERDQEIIDNLAKLSEKHREVIELVYYRELSIKDISVMLDISENTKIAMNIDTKNNDIPERALELLPWFVTNQLSSEDKAYFNEVLQANAALETLVKEEREIFNLVVEDKSLLGLSTLESPEARLENVFKQIDNLPVADPQITSTNASESFVDKLKNTISSWLPTTFGVTDYARFASVALLVISLSVLMAFVAPLFNEKNEFTPAAAKSADVINNQSNTILLVGINGSMDSLQTHPLLKGKLKKVESVPGKKVTTCSFAINLAYADGYALDENVEPLYFDFVYEPKAAPVRTNFIKDELVLLYSTENTSKVKKITQKYNLKPASSTVLASVKTGMMVAKTNGQNPLNLSASINKKEKSVNAGTNNIFRTASTSYKNAYSMYDTGVSFVHETTKGKGTTICMVDTPIDIFHPSLSNAHIETKDLFKVDLNNKEALLHGTSVAGVLVSQNPHIGIAPKAKLYSIGAFKAEKNHPSVLKGSSADVAKAIDACIQHDVDVINLSFTGGKDSIVEKMGQQAIDENKKLFDMADKGRFIDYSAPGVNILTIAPEGKYKLATGTSISSAHVSGIVALLLSQKGNNNLNSALIKTAVDLGKPGRDEEFGEGLISASKALSLLKARN